MNLAIKIGLEDKHSWGVIHNISLNGLLLITKRAFSKEQIICIDVILPKGELSILKGVIKRIKKKAKTDEEFIVGVKLIETDAKYRRYVQQLIIEEQAFEEALISQQQGKSSIEKTTQ